MVDRATLLHSGFSTPSEDGGYIQRQKALQSLSDCRLATYPSERAFHHPPPRQWLETGWEHHSLELVIGSDDEPTARQVRLTS